MRGKKTKEFFFSLLGLWLLLSIRPFVGYTAVPPQINYQGYLTESEGTPVDGTVQMTFTIYDAGTGGNGLWSETQAVTVSRGVYNVNLGEMNPINLDFDKQYYLGIQAGSDDEMTPRLALTSVGYAFRAMTSETDSDTLGELSCNSGQVAKSNGNTWICAADENTQLSEGEIETYVTNGPLDLNPNTTLGGASISTGAHTTSFTKLTDQASDSQIPSGIARVSEVMPTVLANDGAGSTLDADTLDGQDSTAFMSAGTDNWVDTTGDTMTGDLNVLGNVSIGTATPQAKLHVNGDLITKGPWIDVRAFGAKGDGITDDTAFIQAAIDATSAGGTMIMPPGTYKTTANITIEKPLNIVGLGLDTVLFVSGAHYGFIIGAPYASDRGGSIRYLKIQGTEAGLAGIRQGNLNIYTNQPVQVTIKDAHITGFTSPSVTHPVRPGSDGTTGGAGVFDSSSHGYL